MKLFIVFILLSRACILYGQEEPTPLFLDSLSNSSIPQLNSEVDISFSNIPIKELVRTLGNITGINITIDQNINHSVNSNFNGVKAKDVISFLCSRYKLNVKAHGSILYLQGETVNNELLNIVLTDSIISFEVNKVKAAGFFKRFTDETGLNFILSPGVNDVLINGYAKQLEINNAILQLAAGNELEITELSPKLYSVSRSLADKQGEFLNTKRANDKKIKIEYDGGIISADIDNAPLTDVLAELSLYSGYSACILSPVDEKVSLKSKYIDVPAFLSELFFGSENTYRLDGNVLFAGSRKLSGMKSFELVKFNNRRVDSLMAVIPKQIVQDLVIQEFAEQNSIMVWGDADLIFYFRKNIEKLDVIVPVILIDVIIVDAGKNFEIETGLELGLNSEAEKTQGSINPGLDYTMDAGSVNKLLDRVGLTNLGKVSPDFYMKLKAMETDGIIEIRSTPQLATLNGHFAAMSVGQTEYYKEELSNIFGYQNPQMQIQTQYKPVEAKLGITIKPVVAGNGQVTLSINVEQSDFTERIDEFAPPGIESRKFSSMIRVKNQEMILLGGLEENINSSTRSGWPFLSRVPVLKWIFTSKSERKNKSHLNIFIKPTVIY